MAQRSRTGSTSFIVAGIAVALVSWFIGVELVRRANARDLPALPDLSHAPSAVAAYLPGVDRAARDNPRSADALGALAMAYHANLFPAQAEAAYALAALRAPADWRWPYSMALLAEDRGDTSAVVTRLSAALVIDPNLPVALFRLGDAEFKRSGFDAAGAAFSRVHGGPIAPYAALGLARVALQRGDAAAARKILDSAVAGDARRFGSAYRLLAEACRQLGDAAAAARALAMAERLGAYVPPPDPIVETLARGSRHSAFLLKYAALAARARDLQTREYLTRRAYEFDPDNPVVVFEMGTLLQAMGRPGDALAQYERHRVLAPGELQTEVQIGRCLADLDRLPEAEAILRRAVARGDAVAEFNLGEVLDRQERLDEARQHYERAIALNRFHARSYNNLGILAARRGRLAEALAFFDQAGTAAPSDADVQNNRGAVLIQAGRLDEAERAFERALELDPAHRDARQNLDRLISARRLSGAPSTNPVRSRR
jgi:tetratricopeptide (TPR) repeat protein